MLIRVVKSMLMGLQLYAPAGQGKRVLSIMNEKLRDLISSMDWLVFCVLEKLVLSLLFFLFMNGQGKRQLSFLTDCSQHETSDPERQQKQSKQLLQEGMVLVITVSMEILVGMSYVLILSSRVSNLQCESVSMYTFFLLIWKLTHSTLTRQSKVSRQESVIIIIVVYKSTITRSLLSMGILLSVMRADQDIQVRDMKYELATCFYWRQQIQVNLLIIMIKDTQRLNIRLEVLEQARTKLFNPQIPDNDKIRMRREIFLLKLPLFSLIYQKKGQANFKIIVENVKLVKEDFGAIIFDSDDTRTFNFILKGTIMLFNKTRNQDKRMPAKMYKKLGAGEHFGEKMQFGKEQLQSARSVSLCYLLQLDMKSFYISFSGHFQCSELRDQINFVREIWLFSNTRRPIVEKMLLTSQQKQFVRGSVIFREKQPATHLFLIFEGEITLQTLERGKNNPFCILSRSQIYGIEEITQQRNYECSGICTSDYCRVLIIARQDLQSIIDKNSHPKIIELRKRVSIELRVKSSNQRRLQSINALKKTQRSQLIMDKKRRYNTDEKATRRVKTDMDIQSGTLTKIQILNQLFNKQVQLKNEDLRRYRLQYIKDKMNSSLYSTKRLSSYVNKDCTYDKQIILKYLERKQKMYHSAVQKELQYQSKKIIFIPQLKVDRSSAVKNQKRKLKNSRRVTYSQSVL